MGRWIVAILLVAGLTGAVGAGYLLGHWLGYSHGADDRELELRFEVLR
jgi:hypothetical protein